MIKNACGLCEDHAATWIAELSYPVTVTTSTGYQPGRVNETLGLCERCKRQMDEQGDLVSARMRQN